MTDSQTSKSYNDSKHNDLYDFVNVLKESDKLCIIAAIIDDDPYEYDEMSEQDMVDFIMVNLIMSINFGPYKESTDK